MTNNSQPKEIQDKINRIKKEMLDKTNMTENEAYDFAFKCWQCGLDFTKGLEKENQELKKEIQDLKDNETIVADYGVDLWNENEKLKNAIRILKERGEINVFISHFTNKLMLDFADAISCVLEPKEYELLKEVLDNEKH